MNAADTARVHANLLKTWRLLLPAAVAGGLAGCVSVAPVTRVTHSQPAYVAPEKAHEPTRDELDDVVLQEPSARAVIASPGVVKLKKQSLNTVHLTVQQVGHQAPAGPYEFGSYEAGPYGVAPNGPAPAAINPNAIEVCPPEPRYAPAGSFPGGMGPCCNDLAVLPFAKQYPDEYLCDGGDRDYPVHYDRFNRLGLETEDTIAEYIDHRGKERMKPSSKVCVYAPRFAAIRTVSASSEGAAVSEIAGLTNETRGGAMRTHLGPDDANQQTKVGGLRIRSRAGGLERREGQEGVVHTLRPAAHDKLLNTYQDIAFLRNGTIEKNDAAVLAKAMEAAAAWNRDQNPVISVKEEVALEGTHDAHVATITLYDDLKSDQPGELRVVKLADRQTAQPGDVIEFTIRYDNLGPNTVTEVRIVDNLTPRLLYVDDSATSDRAGRLVVEPNGEGSSVLTWEFDEPLPANQGGLVTFKARVR